VQNTLDQSARVTGERELGIDPTSKRKVIVRMGRYGPVAQIGNEQEEGVKAQYASLQKNQSIQSITLEEALELFKLPRIVGERGGEVIKANIGKFGPYVQLGKTYASIPKEEDVMEITLERALELIDLKVQGAANNTIVAFEERPDVLVLNGKYGPYIKVGKLNVKIPKGTEPTSLTLEDCLNLSENQPKSSAKRSGSRKKA
jgi:DNA topoisomerase-1